MIAHVLRLTAWEWFKLRYRWMPWILLAIAIVITQFGVWVAYSSYHSETLRDVFDASGDLTIAYETEAGEPGMISVTCEDILEGRTEDMLETLPEDARQPAREDITRRSSECANFVTKDELRGGFTIPSSIAGAFQWTQAFTAILMIILSASVVGTEYAWGTLRTTLTRGAGRWQLLASKHLLLLLAGAGGMIAVAVAVSIASLIAAVVPPGEVGEFSSGGWPVVAGSFGKIVYAMTPYIALGTFLAVLTQSSALGIALGLAYWILEPVVSLILGVNETLQNFAENVFLSHNVGEWAQSYQTEAARLTGAGEPGALRAFFVILAYTVVLAAGAYVLLLRRDVAGAKGD